MIAFLDLLDTENDKEKFERLYNEYADYLFKVSMNKTNNIHDAEECVQETFLYIAMHFQRINEIDDAKIKSYISTIAMCYAIKKHRKNTKVELIPLEEYNNINRDIGIDTFNDYDAIVLSQLIDKFNEETRLLLYLTYVHGYKSTELSEMFGLSENAIRMRLSRARNQLRDMLEGE